MVSALPTLLDMMPDRLPSSWRALPCPPGIYTLTGSRWWKVGPLTVCVSLDRTTSEGTWLHTSVSAGGRRLPTWPELTSVKNVVHGDRLVVQILPPKSQYVNVAEVLHLWERIDAPTLPASIAGAR